MREKLEKNTLAAAEGRRQRVFWAAEGRPSHFWPVENAIGIWMTALISEPSKMSLFFKYTYGLLLSYEAPAKPSIARAKSSLFSPPSTTEDTKPQASTGQCKQTSATGHN